MNAENAMKATVDIHRAADLEGMGQKLAESIEKWTRDGYNVVSMSHACDPDDSEGRWSVMVLYVQP